VGLNGSLFVAAVCLLGGWRAAQVGLGLAPGDAARLLAAGRVREALALNPRLTAAWIAKGLDAELAGDLPSAEAFLLKAAGVDHGWRPGWTLTNYYFRRGARADFREWAQRTMAIPYSDPVPLFDLAWRADLDVAEIVPPGQRRKYLAFLLRHGQVQAAGPLAVAIAREASPSDRELLLDACEVLIAPPAGLRFATGIWKELDGRNLADPSPGKCFGWRPTGHTEVTIRLGRDISVELSGNQPESLDLLWRFTTGMGPPDARCTAEGLPEPSGLTWLLEPVHPGLSRLVLRYRRPPGTVRAPGILRCTSVTA
jgi:hypothetical protein